MSLTSLNKVIIIIIILLYIIGNEEAFTIVLQYYSAIIITLFYKQKKHNRENGAVRAPSKYDVKDFITQSLGTDYIIMRINKT